MARFIEGADRSQSVFFAERLEDWIGEDNTVRVIDVFVDEMDLGVTARTPLRSNSLLKIAAI